MSVSCATFERWASSVAAAAAQTQALKDYTVSAKFCTLHIVHCECYSGDSAGEQGRSYNLVRSKKIIASVTEHKNRKTQTPHPAISRTWVESFTNALLHSSHSGQLSRGRAHVNVSWVESIFERIRFTFGPCFQFPLSVAILAASSYKHF